MTSPAGDAVDRLREALHPGTAISDAPLEGYAANGRLPRCIAVPVNQEALSRCLAATAELDLAVVPTGIGARMHVGTPPRRYEVAVCTRDLARIVAHEAADMTVTVEAGCPLTTVNGVLAQAGQWIPIDPPLPERTSIGGLIASDASGPLRFSQGKVRDLLIGITVVLADGRTVHGGGRVVKNVAGYDLMKLFTGSWGTIGIVAEATFKVRPRPAQNALLVIPSRTVADAAKLALDVVSAPLAPLYVEIVNASAAGAIGLGNDASALLVGLGGEAEDVAVQQERLRRLCAAAGPREIERPATTPLYNALRDWPALSAAAGDVFGASISVLPSKLGELLPQLEGLGNGRGDIGLVAHAGNGAVSLRASGSHDQGLEWFRAVRDLAGRHGGYAMFDRIPASLRDDVDPWGTEVPGLELMRGIKTTLDPRDLLSPGRFVGGI